MRQSTIQLEHCMALDLAFSMLARGAQREATTLLLPSSPALAEEMLLRVTPPATFVVDSLQAAEDVRKIVDDQTIGQAPSFQIVPADSDTLSATGTQRRAIWAFPHPPTWRQRLRLLDAATGTGMTAVILVAGPGTLLMRPFRSASGFAAGPWLAASLRKELTRLGFRLEGACDIGSPALLGWAVMARVSAALGRPDLARRCVAAYVQSSTRFGPRLASCRLLVARKDGPACRQ